MINGEKMLYRIEKDNITLLDETTLPSEEILENHLEDWVEKNSDLLGEQLLIIGRQVKIDDVKDTLDLLAVDKNGHLVVIELKRDRTGKDVDFQALKYVSYISRWGYDDIKKHAENYFKNYLNKNDFNLEAELENFCEKDYELNEEQRIVIVGRKIDKKIGSVALWLLDHNVNIKVVEITTYKDYENIYLHPKIIIPPPTTEIFELGKGKVSKEKPWLVEGKEWHLNQKCGNDIRQKLLGITDVISQISGVDGPNWNQKNYISFTIKNKIWIKIITHVSFLHLIIHSDTGKFLKDNLSSMLNIANFEQEASFSDKLRTKSAIGINISSNDEILLVVKDDFDYSTKEFESLIKETRDSFFKMS